MSAPEGAEGRAPREMSGDTEAGGRSCRPTLCGLTGCHSPECRDTRSEGYLGWGAGPLAEAAPAAPPPQHALPALAEWKAVSEAARGENPGNQAAAGRALLGKCPGVTALRMGGLPDLACGGAVSLMGDVVGPG